MSKQEFLINGWKGCHYFAKAKGIVSAMEAAKPEVFSSTIKEYQSKDEYKSDLANLKKQNCKSQEDITKAESHMTSPIIWKFENGSSAFIGGASDLESYAKKAVPEYEKKLSSHH